MGSTKVFRHKGQGLVLVCMMAKIAHRSEGVGEMRGAQDPRWPDLATWLVPGMNWDGPVDQPVRPDLPGTKDPGPFRSGRPGKGRVPLGGSPWPPRSCTGPLGSEPLRSLVVWSPIPNGDSMLGWCLTWPRSTRALANGLLRPAAPMLDTSFGSQRLRSRHGKGAALARHR